VRLEIDPADHSGRKTITIERDRIELKDSEARSEVIERGTKSDGTPYRLGVIQLPSFYMDMDGARLNLPDYKSTTRDVQRLLEGFKRENVDAVVIDLRWNGGGSLTEAVNMSGLFIDEGPVVQVKGPDGRTQPYQDPNIGQVWEGPLVVIINKFSASASEIFAGAIRDHHRGTIIGTRSYGKGTVQGIFPMGRVNAGLRLTTAKFYSPNGHGFSKVGVSPDVQIQHVARPVIDGDAASAGTIATSAATDGAQGVGDDDPCLSTALNRLRNGTPRR
jgi:carboxyl-terminal processing protease